MRTSRRSPRLARGLAIGAAALILLGVAGCRGEHSPGEAHDHDEDHIGHVIPAHRPKSFPEAVRRLRAMNDRFARGEAVPPGDPSWGIALDIANWLPEIAAESEMPEKPWDEVNGRSAAIVSDYRAILTGAGDERERLSDAGRAIAGLEAVLGAADPRWFDDPERHAGTP